MKRRTFPRSNSKSATIPPLVRLWMLRIGVALGGHKRFVSRTGFDNEDIAELLGLGKWIDPIDFDFDQKAVRLALRKAHELAEIKFQAANAPARLRKNVKRMAALVGLSATDCQILEFTVLIHSDRRLATAADWLGCLSSSRALHVISEILDLSESQVRTALSGHGALTSSGLVSIDHNEEQTLRDKFALLSSSFAERITSTNTDPILLLRDTVALAAPPELEMTDYRHILRSLSVLMPYLQQSIKQGRRGVNIYIHGDPGTGKSQLARVIAKELDLRLFEVASEDGDGDPVDGSRRMRAFRSAQSFLARGRAMVVFDEAEDIFSPSAVFSRRKSTAQGYKAWLNRILEANPVPTLWLSNSVGDLDPAFIRRFDMVFELPIPPKEQREAIIRDACSGLLDDAGISRFAETATLAPAVVARAASVVKVIRKQIGGDHAAEAFEMLIGNTLKAQGHEPLPRNDTTRLAGSYDPAFIQADANMGDIANGLVQSRSGRLCLYGPPGTGKTAFGRWLAEQMGVPLIVKRASDLMSKWVGGNEKNIARAFQQAEEERGLLLIDEVDSFLQDRRGAQRGWEVSMVNEMLTQMETFTGVFIATTNLMEGLDSAALRRFDLKAKFDYLRPGQAAALFDRYCTQLGIADCSSEPSAGVRRVHNLTPGDFAAVVRQNRFRRIESAASLLSALEAECAIKSAGKSAIGFI